MGVGVGVDIVPERALAYEDRLELLARVIESSARSTFEEKIDAPGRVLADGLHEDGDIAEALVLARALERPRRPAWAQRRHKLIERSRPRANGACT